MTPPRLTSLWEYERDHYPAGCQTATFDSNHDNVISRPGSQYGGDRAKIILAEALNLLSPNVPIIYYGNEVGMKGRAGTDLDLRQPMDWAAVEAQTAQPDSILSWCRYLTRARAAYPALRGAYATLATDLGPGKALAYLRHRRFRTGLRRGQPHRLHRVRGRHGPRGPRRAPGHAPRPHPRQARHHGRPALHRRRHPALRDPGLLRRRGRLPWHPPR